ncbi:Histidinol-phosphate aminotransferase 2 [Thalassovita gelatinovora]|uniref:Histidinol-phosphate aminotransferase n=1 Tax=Thalassovita gelatinovora TaxID=53501 RepID=A0A0N7LUU4_THAGE|nr:histidinol-phosphate transaminase [Thalassovita gelatinovora]QIZ81347.1 histidinol-phosphate transaminase [Thalassovita gelatinovora]CUH64466.1 Histidinol-phosphate aminotransferase 2 [Thalassovita gelatinovora]SEP98127.1 histidinol-phosphate aminotransferase [Thalassovita gelatinovora]
MTKIKPQPGIMEIDLYVGGAAHVEGVSDVVKLSSNENPYGPSPEASSAARRASYELHRYPSTDHAQLRAAIGEIHDVDPDNVICGVGSDEVLQFIAQSYAGPGDEVIYTEHGFSMYPILAHACGATPVKVAEQNRVVDIDAILAACTDKTRIVFIANPANPTGTMIDLDACAQLAKGLPAGALLVLDGAYAEFEAGYDGGVSLVERSENVIMTRTFSKIYGLGGLRIGWGYAPRTIIDVLNRVRQPFNLSTVQLAAAEAALRDTSFTEKCRSDNERLRRWLATALEDLGVASDPSHTNFILARFADQDEADACDAYLKTQGLIVRKVAGYGLPNCLRITIGDESSCRRVAHAIGQFKRGET